MSSDDEVSQPRSKSVRGISDNYDCYDMDAHIVLNKNSTLVTVVKDVGESRVGGADTLSETKAEKNQGGEIKAFELEDDALRCYHEVQEYVKMYGVLVFDKLTFPSLMKEFFTSKNC